MSRSKALFAAAALAAAAFGAVPAAAQVSSNLTPSQSIVVAKDKSAAFRLDYPAGQIVVAQPETLELVATTDHSFYVRGKALGVTNLLIYDRSHHLAQVVDVRVGYDVDSLQADLGAALPAEHITAVNFAGGVLLQGDATTSGAAARAQAIAERYAPTHVTSELNIKTTQQVMVEVRIIEVNRSALKDLGFNAAVNASGFNFSSGGSLISGQAPQGSVGVSGGVGSLSFSLTLNALEQRGLVRTLAKPNLIAMSGEEASFLAGGEFPYPVPSGLNQTTIEFKPFGVKLNVTPNVMDNGQIRLKVAPEVSALDPTNHLTIGGFSMPSLTVRKANTTVELRDGQSFAIAGLFQQGYANAVSQIPWAADVPILGALFRSTSWKRNETELVIIVTPHLTSPSDSPEALPNPLASGEEPDMIDLILHGRAFDQALAAPVTAKGR